MNLINRYRRFVARFPWLGGLCAMGATAAIVWATGWIPLGDSMLEKTVRVVLLAVLGVGFLVIGSVTAHGLMDSDKKKK